MSSNSPERQRGGPSDVDKEDQSVPILLVDSSGTCHAVALKDSPEELSEADTYLVDEFGRLYSANEDNSCRSLQGGRPEQAPSSPRSVLELPNLPKFQVSDHIYKWCSLPGVEQAYQHHAIVLDVEWHGVDGWRIQIADFSWRQAQVGESVRQAMWQGWVGDNEPDSGNSLRTYTIPANDPTWFKVEYEAAPSSSVEGEALATNSTTTAHCDDADLVKKRVLFLLGAPEVLPSYDLLEANCECVAVWCKTGVWATLQVILRLDDLSRANQHVLWDVAHNAFRRRLGQSNAASSSTAATAAAAAVGSLASTPTSRAACWAAYGAAAVAGPRLLLWHTKRQWQAVTEYLNEEFLATINDDQSLVAMYHRVERRDEVLREQEEQQSPSDDLLFYDSMLSTLRL